MQSYKLSRKQTFQEFLIFVCFFVVLYLMSASKCHISFSVETNWAPLYSRIPRNHQNSRNTINLKQYIYVPFHLKSLKWKLERGDMKWESFGYSYLIGKRMNRCSTSSSEMEEAMEDFCYFPSGFCNTKFRPSSIYYI